MCTNEEIDRLLAKRFPHLDRNLLSKMNRGINRFKQHNGGNVQALVRWNKGRFKWLDWIDREYSEEEN
jgi:hypothetical protein